jgi:hypothetical protein
MSLKIIMFLIMILSFSHVFGKNSELHLKVDNRVIQVILNDAVKHIQDDDGYIRRNLSSFQHELSFNLNGLSIDREIKEYAQNFSTIDFDGQGQVKILLETPRLRGNLYFENPKFIKRKDGKFNAEVFVVIRNFNLNFDHIWFTSSGIVNLEKISQDSCHNLITSSSAIDGQDFILDAPMKRDLLRAHLNNFYFKLNRESYKGHQGKLWARIDNFALGWGISDKYYRDDRNNLKIKLKLIIDPKKGGEGINLVSFTHNFNKKGGAILPVYLPRENIIIPPTFIRTQSRKIVDDFITDEEIPRCTWVDPNPTKIFISSLSGDIASQISRQVTDENVQKIVSMANGALDKISIPELPENLVVTNEDVKALRNSYQVFGETFYIFENVKFDFQKDLYGIIKNFTTYRAALGLEDLKTGPEGEFLEMSLNSNLRIDGTTLAYHESLLEKLPIKSSLFKWSQDFGSNISLAINGDFLNKIINPIKDHLLETNVPDSISVHLNDNLFQVDYQGNIEFHPYVEVYFKNYEVLRVNFKVKAKVELYTGQDLRDWIKLRLDVPDAKSIVSQIKVGKLIRNVDNAANIASVLLWPIYPIKEYYIKPKIRNAMASAIQQYIDNIQGKIKDIEITEFVKTYGVRPHSLKFHKLSKDNYMELKLQVIKIYGLDKVMKDLK